MSAQGVLIDVAPYAGNDDDDVRYTLDEADAWLREKAGVTEWDLDVAGCNESHRARYWYTLERGEDGLTHSWEVPAVFCNPPWSSIDPWIERAWNIMLRGEVFPEVIGFLLPLRTHRPWWQRWIEPFRELPAGVVGSPNGFRIRAYHPPTRFRYGAPGNPRGAGVVEPNFQTVGIVFSRCR